MKFLILAVFTTIQVAVAADQPFLILAKEHPYLKCSVYSDKVTMERKNGDIKFSKIVPYKIASLGDFVEQAYLEKRSPNEEEYLAIRESGEAFNLNVNEKISRNLIHTMSDVCEVRNFR